MSARHSEDVAATLFADVHYYYNSPNSQPVHHRFDKASYVYIYENATQRRSRLEIANNAGTQHQDAFEGFLDNIQVDYSYKHSCLVTITVDGARTSPHIDTNQWHLPAFDQHNQNKYLYRIHTIDLYFYLREDALVFLNAIRRILPDRQVRLSHGPARPVSHHEPMSNLVQSLEHNVSISNPTYEGHTLIDSRAILSTQSSADPQSTAYLRESPQARIASIAQSPPQLFPGPPPPPPGPPPQTSPQPSQVTAQPLAYNPAAPPAPEPVAHREKTPPPLEDGNSVNPLLLATTSDQPQSFNAASNASYPPFSPLSPENFFPGPPTQSYPAATPPPVAQAYPAFTTVQSPSSPPLLRHVSQSSTPQSGFPFTQPSQPEATGYNVHQQVYIPTDEERKTKHGKVIGRKGSGVGNAGDSRGRLEERADRVEKGVTRFLKRLEKKIG